MGGSRGQSACENSDQLKVQRDKLIARFGKAFDGDYGWASSVIGINRPTMSAIEQHVQLDHMRPYYRMASDNVHPNSHGAYFRLGLHSSQHEEVLLAGPSNLGLADPGHSTAISLLQLATTLLATEADIDCVVTMRLLAELADEVGEAFPQSTSRIGNLGDGRCMSLTPIRYCEQGRYSANRSAEPLHTNTAAMPGLLMGAAGGTRQTPEASAMPTR